MGTNVIRSTARKGEVMFYARFWVRRKALFHVVSVLVPSVIVGILGVPALMVADGTTPNGIVLGGESPLSFVAGLLLTIMAMKFAFTDSLEARLPHDAGHASGDQLLHVGRS